MKRYLLATVIFCSALVWGCKENNTTAPDLGFIEVNPRTAAVTIPYDDFVSGFQVYGGYGSAADFGRGVVALDFAGANVRALMKIEDLPTSADVVGSDGVSRTDSDLSFVGGRVVLSFDTIDGTLNVPVGIEVFGVVEEWHGPTATWDVAVDTAGDRRDWTQLGGGALNSLGAGTYAAFSDQQFDPELPLLDTLSISVDSAAVAGFLNPGGGSTGFLLAATFSGTSVNVVDLKLVLNTVPSTQPDTVVELSVGTDDVTFIIEGVPPAPVGWLRVGGTPSWRSVISLTIPSTVDGTVDLCGAVGCQVDLREVDLNLAELVLTTRQPQSGFQPQDTTVLDLRRVLNPELLPKSPLGSVLLPAATIVPPALFSTDVGAEVSFTVTRFVREVLEVAAETGSVPDASLVLLSLLEPSDIGFASFAGSGGVGAPELRLLFTVANEVGLP